MKIPDKEKIIETIDRYVKDDYDLGRHKYYEYLAKGYGTSLVDDLILLFKVTQIDENSEEEKAELDPNLVKIAELEAKLFVYEEAIRSAGLKILQPKDKESKKK